MVHALNLRVRAAEALKQFRLRRALSRLARRKPGASFDGRLFGALIGAWGNEGWSASGAYLHSICCFLAETTGGILECGSGLSTLVVATLMRGELRRVLALEHHAEWARRVRDVLAAHALPDVQVSLTTLRSYGAFDWYDLDGVRLPEEIGLVICDGPPASTRGGRIGALYALAPRLAPGCIVLLDDTQRPEEQAIMDRWRADFRLKTILEGGSFTALRLEGATDAAASPRPAAKTVPE